MSMSRKDLEILLAKKEGISDLKLKMLSKKSDQDPHFFERIEVTDELERLIK
jgi:hypothetical protein